MAGRSCNARVGVFPDWDGEAACEELYQASYLGTWVGRELGSSEDRILGCDLRRHGAEQSSVLVILSARDRSNCRV